MKIINYRRIPRLRTPLCMLGLGKSGEGLIRGILTFPCDDHYRPPNITWARDLCTFSGCLVGKTREKRQSKAYCDTHIASLLAVATVFIDLWTPFYSQGGGGGLIRETKLPMQELELKMQGGLMREGGA